MKTWRAKTEAGEKLRRARIRSTLFGHSVSEETRGKLSEANRGKSPWNKGMMGIQGTPKSDETRMKISASLKGRKRPPNVIEKIIKNLRPGFRGPHTKETKAKLSKVHKLKASDPGYVNPFKGKTHSPENRLKMATFKGRSHSEEEKAKIRAAMAGKPMHSIETRKKIAEARRRQLENPLAEKKRAQASAKALSLHPNRLERASLAVLIDAFPDAGWKFNPGIVIAGKVPDFVRSDDIPVMVDVFGDYWHAEESPRPRQRLFRKAGYHLVVVWEKELRKDSGILIRRVKRAIAGVPRVGVWT